MGVEGVVFSVPILGHGEAVSVQLQGSVTHGICGTGRPTSVCP